jgi:hypothetical protein
MLNIIIDTREKKPWKLTDKDIGSIQTKKLHTGDYTLVGLEDKFVIERKSSLAEFANNIIQARFKKELERLITFKYKYIIIECGFRDIINFPVGSIPKHLWSKIKTTGTFIMKCIAQIQTKYDVHIMLCENTDIAKQMALSIMKRVIELEKS